MDTVQALGGPIGAAAVTTHLDELGMHYELITHKPTFRAVDDAAASGVTPPFELKTLVLRDGPDLVLVALPASERLDLGKVRELLGHRDVGLADEDEMAAAFPRFDVGALPPIGPGLPPLALLDARVKDYSRVVCAGGDHSHSLVVIPIELIDRSRPRLADICED